MKKIICSDLLNIYLFQEMICINKHLKSSWKSMENSYTIITKKLIIQKIGYYTVKKKMIYKLTIQIIFLSLFPEEFKDPETTENVF